MFTLKTYTWRGKTFKTIDGLCKRAFRDFPGYSIGFTETHMVLSQRGAPSLQFVRTFDATGNSVISSEVTL